jgi:hypothetical protein
MLKKETKKISIKIFKYFLTIVYSMSRTLKKILNRYIMYYLYKKKHMGSIEKDYFFIKKSQKTVNIYINNLLHELLLLNEIMIKY